MSQDGIFSRRGFNMGGMEIDITTHEVVKDGRVMFGTNFILDKGGSFEFIIQQTRDGEPIKKIELKAKTERSARIEINKIFPQLKNAYNKPSFVSLERLEAEIQKRDLVVGTTSNGL